jgi:hypothetical protein
VAEDFFIERSSASRWRRFGRKYATTNYGMLYTAKGTASLVVPLASIVAAIFNIISAVVASAVLDPLRLWLRRPARCKPTGRVS